MPASLIPSGKISAMTIIGIDRMPIAALKMIKDALVTGIQLKDSTSTPRDLSIIYKPKMVSPDAVPTFDNISKG